MCVLLWISMRFVFCLVGEKMWEKGRNLSAEFRGFNYWGLNCG